MKVDLALRNCSSVTLIGFCDACICCRLFTAFAAAMAFPLDCCHLELIFTEKRSFSRKKGLLFSLCFAFSTFFNGTNKHKIMKGCFPTRLLPTRVVALEEVFTCCKGESRIQSLQGHYREIRYLLQYIHMYVYHKKYT